MADPRDPMVRIGEMRELNAPVWQQYVEFSNSMRNDPRWPLLNKEAQGRVLLNNFGFSDPKEFMKSKE